MRNGAGTVRVRGEVDLDTIERLVAAVAAATTPGGSVELDLREVDFLDSAGIAGLNRCRRHAARVGAAIVVVVLERSPVAKLLQWTGLAHEMDVRAD